MGLDVTDLLNRAEGAKIAAQKAMSDNIYTNEDIIKEYMQKVKSFRNMEFKSILDYNNLLNGFIINYVWHRLFPKNTRDSLKTINAVFQNGYIEYNGDVGILTTIINNKAAYWYMLDMLVKGEFPSTALFLQFQEILTRGLYDTEALCSGERPGTIRTAESPVGYVSPFPSITCVEVLDELFGVIHSLQHAGYEKMLEAVVTFLGKVDVLKPFAVGNNSVPMFMANYILMYYGYPPFYIESADRADFSYCLSNYVIEDNTRKLMAKIITGSINAWKDKLQESNVCFRKTVPSRRDSDTFKYENWFVIDDHVTVSVAEIYYHSADSWKIEVSFKKVQNSTLAVLRVDIPTYEIVQCTNVTNAEYEQWMQMVYNNVESIKAHVFH